MPSASLDMMICIYIYIYICKEERHEREMFAGYSGYDVLKPKLGQTTEYSSNKIFVKSAAVNLVLLVLVNREKTLSTTYFLESLNATGKN